MKKIVLIVLWVVLISFSAGAQGVAKAGQFGLQSGLTFTSSSFGYTGAIGATYVISETFSMRAALGFQAESDKAISGLDLGVGINYHFPEKGGVSPYAGAEFSYSTYSSPDPEYGFGFCGVFGGEYFFSSNFSWAGEARVGLLGNYSPFYLTMYTRIGTLGFATYLTWYLN